MPVLPDKIPRPPRSVDRNSENHHRHIPLDSSRGDSRWVASFGKSTPYPHAARSLVLLGRSVYGPATEARPHTTKPHHHLLPQHTTTLPHDEDNCLRNFLETRGRAVARSLAVSSPSSPSSNRERRGDSAVGSEFRGPAGSRWRESARRRGFQLACGALAGPPSAARRGAPRVTAPNLRGQ